MSNKLKTKIITVINSIGISAITLAIFLAIWLNFYDFTIYYFWGHIILVFIFFLIFLISIALTDGFKVSIKSKFELLFNQTLSLIIAYILIYLQLSLTFLRMLNIIPFFIGLIMSIIAYFLWNLMITLLLKKFISTEAILLLYKDKPSQELINKINKRYKIYQITTTINYMEDISKIKKSAKEHDTLLMHNVPLDLRNELIKFCFDENINVYIVPRITDIIFKSSEDYHIVDTPLVKLNNENITLETLAIKRLFDIIFSLLGIIITSPIMIIVAICVKLCDRGPVLYKQKRYTKDRKIFTLCKFRSMIQNAESKGQAVLAKENDDRITPVGKFIRATRLDELPQLFNIFMGSMSLIGPRPERPEIAQQYEKELPEFKYRLKVKAGLTGYAQVHGKYNTTSYDKLRLDLMYIEKYSLILDVKIILLTIGTIFKKTSTEGVDKNKTIADYNAEDEER